jgi:phospholipid-binding lipoprotein MlaA
MYNDAGGAVSGRSLWLIVVDARCKSISKELNDVNVGRWRVAPHGARVALGVVLLVVAVAMLGACARSSDPAARQEAIAQNDRFENVNRAIFEINRTLDEVLLKPMAILYVGIVPEFGRQRITNALDNLGEPVTFVNDLLQGEFERAGVTLARFLLNSTVGFLGMFDVAAEGAGLEGHKEDFGQTLAVWGMEEGPYIMLPMYGPSNPRDAIGLVADIFMDPFTYVFDSGTGMARFGVTAVSRRADFIEGLEAVEKTSVDFYAALRNLYRENRNKDIRNGALVETIEIPSVEEDE